MSMAISRFNLKDSFFDGQQGHIEGTTSEIENKDILFLGALFI
jgi:hypothetical protein